MVGIICSSATKTMTSGSTSADNALAGWITREQCTLSTYPASGSAYLWGLAKPSDSGVTCVISDTADAAPTFTPDVDGYYTVTCTVDGVTDYVLRVAVADVANVSTLSAIRLLPMTNAQVSTPATGATLFYSSTSGAVCVKLTDGTVHSVSISA